MNAPLETSQDDYTEETNIVQTQLLPYTNTIALTDPSSRPYKIQFVKVMEKVLPEHHDSLDIDLDLDSITGTDIDNLISTEKEAKMNDEELINFLIHNDYQDSDKPVKEEDKQAKLTLSKRMEQYFKKRVKKLETIQERINEEKTKELSFAPMINRIGKTKMRTFEEFIRSQREHLKRVCEKILQLKQKNIQEENEVNTNKPRIDAQSEKLAANRLKDGSDVYGRLYSLRSQSPSMKEMLSKSSNTSMISKCQLSKEQEEFYAYLYNDAQNRKDKVKMKEDQLKQEFLSNQPKSNLSSTKILFDKFQAQFKREVSLLPNSDLSSKALITKKQLAFLLSQLYFITNAQKSVLEASEEQKMVDALYDSLLNTNVSKDKVSIEHLYIFCLSIIGLLDYYILSAYQGNNISFITNGSSYPNQSFLLNKIDVDLTSKILRYKQYGGFDSDDNYIITITQSRAIFKDFKALSFNWKSYLNATVSKARKLSREPTTQPIPSEGQARTPQPHLQGNKSMKALTDSTKDLSLFTHIQQSLLRKKEMERIIQQRNNDKLTQEMSNCTFKPKINKHSFYNDNIIPIERTTESTQELLFRKGTMMQLVKSERKKIDIEYDNYKEECTFKPVINQGMAKCVPSAVQTEENEKFNERMKKGRIEREYKTNAMNLRSGPIASVNVKQAQRKEKQRTTLQETQLQSNSTFDSQVNGSTIHKAKAQPLTSTDMRQLAIMVIDIKLQDGIKKPLYVYEGSTPDQLAKQFSLENNIEMKKQIKLKELIEKEMDKHLNRRGL